MLEYKICNILVPKNGGEIGNYEINRVSDYEKKLTQRHKPEKEVISYKFTKEPVSNGKNEGLAYHEEFKSVIPEQYGSHQITAVATPKTVETRSVFSNDKTQIYDILLFYNFLTGINTCLDDDMSMFIHKCKIGAEFSEQQVTSLIEMALKEISKPEWQSGAKDKDILAFLFYLNAKDSNKSQIRYIQFFTCLDMYDTPKPPFEGRIFDSYSFPGRVIRFDKNNFIEAIRIIRNKYVHIGHCTLNDFQNEIIKSKAMPSFKVLVSRFRQEDFDKFQFDCSYILDCYLYWVFCIIFGIADKIDKTRADFLHYMGKDLSNKLELFQ